MIKEIKYLFFIVTIIIFIFFTGRYYFSDGNKKKSYRSISNINDKINIYTNNLPVLSDDTKNIIEYTEKMETQKRKKYLFWNLINKND
jgi:hypothetical protein